MSAVRAMMWPVNEIDYIAGPRNGERERGEFLAGRQLLTLVPSDSEGAEALDGVR